MRFGTSQGLPIKMQIVGKWQAESTILHVAPLLESISPARASSDVLRRNAPGAMLPGVIVAPE